MKRSALIVEFATLKRSFHSLEGASAPVLFVRLLLLVVQALMADGAVAPVDARMRVQDVWSGATTREPRRESQLTYPVGNSCGICGYMYVDRCCVLLLLSGAMHGVSCSVALLLSPRLAPCPRDIWLPFREFFDGADRRLCHRNPRLLRSVVDLLCCTCIHVHVLTCTVHWYLNTRNVPAPPGCLFTGIRVPLCARVSRMCPAPPVSLTEPVNARRDAWPPSHILGCDESLCVRRHRGSTPQAG